MRSFFRKLFAPWMQPDRREFMAGAITRLTNDWNVSVSTPDQELQTSLVEMRKRSRDHERNNDFVRRYLKLLENNVIGSAGIRLQMKVREWSKSKEGVWTEKLDTTANGLIEEGWAKWTKPKACHIGGQLSFYDLTRMGLRSVARDGATLFRKHYPKESPWHFALEPIEIDHLDTDHNKGSAPDGVNIRLGVEYDTLGRVAAYHLLRNHPGDGWVFKGNGKWRERVPASQIIHLYLPERFGQSTGFPWLASAIPTLRHIAKYIEAEVVAARVAAAKMGFLVPGQNAPPIQYTGEQGPEGTYMEVAPGTIEKLPIGWDFKAFDPTHPNAVFPEFIKAQLRAVAAGLGVSYTSLANDLEGVNYSSIRAGLLEEREEWKALQRWLVDWFITPIFEEWLMLALTSGAIAPLPASKFDKFNAPEWKARRWDWVDPLKDMQAAVLGIEKGLTSRRAVIAEGGGDVEDTFGDLKADADLAEQYGLEFATDAPPPPEESKAVDKEEKEDA